MSDTRKYMTRETTEQVRIRLQEIAESNGGRLTPEDVVEDAKDKKSPLHGQFEWDKGKAAYAYWLEQARLLIRSVRVDIQTNNVTIKAVGYVRDPNCGSREQGYIAVESLVSEKESARRVLTTEFRRIRSFYDRVNEIAQVCGLANEVEAIHEAVLRAESRLEEMDYDDEEVGFAA